MNKRLIEEEVLFTLIEEQLNEMEADGYCGIVKKIDFSKATNLTSILSSAFYQCTGLVDVDLSACRLLTTIESDAFYGCTALEDILIPDTCKTIGSYCFDNCSSLRILFQGKEKPAFILSCTYFDDDGSFIALHVQLGK